MTLKLKVFQNSKEIKKKKKNTPRTCNLIDYKSFFSIQTRYLRINHNKSNQSIAGLEICENMIIHYNILYIEI